DFHVTGVQTCALPISLGGTVRQSERGWGVGLSFNQVIERKDWMQPFQAHLDLLVSHQDQVVILPPQAQVLATSEFCPYYLIQYEIGRASCRERVEILE